MFPVRLRERGRGWFIIWVCNLVLGWICLGMNLVRIGVLMKMMLRSGDNSLRNNLIRVTIRIRLVIGHLTLDYGGNICCPWIV